MKNLFEMIYKRRSVRKFDPENKLTKDELNEIENKLPALTPLYPEIKLAYKIVKREETNVRFGEYVLIIYSEEKEGWLTNIGYVIEELDLWLAEKNIGACWYGMGRPTDEQKEHEGCKYAVMFTFGKSLPEDFRADKSEFSRKDLGDIWWGDTALDAAEAARLAPSACNSQPWLVKCEDNVLTVYQKRTFVTRLAKSLNQYFNIMDVGIFMRILEIALMHFGYEYQRELLVGDEDKNLAYVAKYILKEKSENE